MLERLDEYFAVFVLSWITLCPLVTFQALLAARDDNQIAHGRSSPSATEVATPLLIMLGWMTLVVTYACLSFKTKFEVSDCANCAHIFMSIFSTIECSRGSVARFSRLTSYLQSVMFICFV